MIICQHEQGSDEWLEARRGVITGSRFKDARDKTAKGLMTARASLYAMDVARERCGGIAQAAYVNAAMRMGTEQEPLARQAYEARTGNLVDEAGFITTDDCTFGVSVDGLVDEDGMVEIKTMVSSDTLFTAVVDGDYSAYMDQINGSLWLLGRQWCDLILWAPDLPSGKLTVVRVRRNEDAIQKLEDDLLAFEKVVTQHTERLSAKIAPHQDVAA
jgi:exodeoxyribonuclease (lambda-induced)